ncbi:RagB/SusD family nutrient uptake outer membrane protein [Pedobacter sp. GR22-6]|uniref:RagB/SusD family nutrient uptake outer membrane protein n=1 Tax=Pedobacter sp. GR22-6 TaxID=3127957 RepID=UPI00307D539A
MKTSIVKFWLGGIFLLMLTASCRKYVEVQQYSSRTLINTTDYQFLMNNRDEFKLGYILPTVVNDDMATVTASHQATWGSEIKNAYIWAEQYYVQGQMDVGWNNLYKQIYTSNEVLYGVMSSKNGTEALKKEIYAEALVQRAYAYLMLVNQYGEIYNPASAGTQIGVPLLLTPDLYQPLNRASLKTIYDKVIKDLEEALPSLPNAGTNNGHPDKASAYALLSRTHLYMRNYDLAGEYADKSLALRSTLLDLRTYVGNTAAFPRSLQDPEILLFKNTAGTFRSELNPELLALFATGDQRYTLYTGTQSGVPGRAFVRPNFTFEGIYAGPSVPEMILNRAEVYARAGNIAKTQEFLNKLREKRFTTATYVPLVIASATDLLPAVVNERRREFMGTGLRWFDQRRYSLDPGITKPVTRTFENQSYTLTAGSNRYIFPVAPGLLDLNPEIQQSPR